MDPAGVGVSYLDWEIFYVVLPVLLSASSPFMIIGNQPVCVGFGGEEFPVGLLPERIIFNMV